MQIHLKAPKIWVANEPVDFRKQIDGLSAIVSTNFNRSLDDHIYIFHNRSKNKLKILAHHRNGSLLIYKRLNKKKFSLKGTEPGLYEVNEQQLAWLLAGFDWIDMSEFKEHAYNDYF